MRHATIIFLSVSMMFLISCSSTKGLKTEEQLNKSLREQIYYHVKSMNDGNKEGLEKVYSEDYEGIFPVSKFKSKEELITQLIENQQIQKIKIEIEIIELSAKSGMGYAVLNWKAISNFGTPNQDLLYNKKHLQIWIENDNNWQLTRSLFYN